MAVLVQKAGREEVCRGGGNMALVRALATACSRDVAGDSLALSWALTAAALPNSDGSHPGRVLLFRSLAT